MVNIPYQNAGIAGFEQGDSYASVELFSGSTPLPATEDFAVEAGVSLAVNSVVGLVGGYLVLASEDQAEPTSAVGAITFANQPSADDTVTVGSQTYTFKAALSAADQVLIGATTADTVDNLIAAINGAAGEGTTYGTDTAENTSAVARENTSTVIGLVAREEGTAGNSVALAKSATNITVSGATLAGGLEEVGIKPIGITTAAVVGGAADQSIAIFRSGCFNPAALNWHASYDSDAKKVAAFRGADAPTNILIRKFL